MFDLVTPKRVDKLKGLLLDLYALSSFLGRSVPYSILQYMASIYCSIWQAIITMNMN